MVSKEYKILSGQSIFDVVNLTIGDLNSTYQLLLDNTSISNISSIPTGLEVQYTPMPTIPALLNSSSSQSQPISENYYSIMNQSLYDVCLMTYGDLNNIYNLIQDSNFSNLQIYPSPNTLFIFNPQKIKDNLFKNYLLINGITIITGEFVLPKYDYLLQDDGFYLLQDDGFRIKI